MSATFTTPTRPLHADSTTAPTPLVIFPEGVNPKLAEANRQREGARGRPPLAGATTIDRGCWLDKGGRAAPTFQLEADGLAALATPRPADAHLAPVAVWRDATELEIEPGCMMRQQAHPLDAQPRVTQRLVDDLAAAGLHLRVHWLVVDCDYQKGEDGKRITPGNAEAIEAACSALASAINDTGAQAAYTHAGRGGIKAWVRTSAAVRSRAELAALQARADRWREDIGDHLDLATHGLDRPDKLSLVNPCRGAWVRRDGVDLRPFFIMRPDAAPFALPPLPPEDEATIKGRAAAAGKARSLEPMPDGDRDRFASAWAALGLDLAHGDHDYFCVFHDNHKSEALGIDSDRGLWRCRSSRSSCGGGGFGRLADRMRQVDADPALAAAIAGRTGKPLEDLRRSVRLWCERGRSSPSTYESRTRSAEDPAAAFYRTELFPGQPATCGLTLWHRQETDIVGTWSACNGRDCPVCAPRWAAEIEAVLPPLLGPHVEVLTVQAADYGRFSRALRRSGGMWVWLPAGVGCRTYVVEGAPRGWASEPVSDVRATIRDLLTAALRPGAVAKGRARLQKCHALREPYEAAAEQYRRRLRGLDPDEAPLEDDPGEFIGVTLNTPDAAAALAAEAGFAVEVGGAVDPVAGWGDDADPALRQVHGRVTIAVGDIPTPELKWRLGIRHPLEMAQQRQMKRAMERATNARSEPAEWTSGEARGRALASREMIA